MENLSDQELIEELKRRIKKNKAVLEEKSRLLFELELVNRRLIESERLKSQFISNIRNEIKNPLTSILGMSENLVDCYDNKERLRDIGKLIFQEAFSLDFQLRNIFFAAELEAGELRQEITNVDIENLVNQVLESLDHLIKKRNVHFNVDIKLEEKFFKSDAEKIHVILSNLIDNAVTFNRENGQVNLKIRESENQLVIDIEDFGIGISKEDQAMIYDRFKQLDSGSTKTFGGHGLGLSIVRELLDMINGEISLRSEPGKGSTFTVILQEGSPNKDMNFTLGGNEFLFDEGDEIF